MLAVVLNVRLQHHSVMSFSYSRSHNDDHVFLFMFGHVSWFLVLVLSLLLSCHQSVTDSVHLFCVHVSIYTPLFLSPYVQYMPKFFYTCFKQHCKTAVLVSLKVPVVYDGFPYNTAGYIHVYTVSYNEKNKENLLITKRKINSAQKSKNKELNKK